MTTTCLRKQSVSESQLKKEIQAKLVIQSAIKFTKSIRLGNILSPKMSPKM